MMNVVITYCKHALRKEKSTLLALPLPLEGGDLKQVTVTEPAWPNRHAGPAQGEAVTVMQHCPRRKVVLSAACSLRSTTGPVPSGLVSCPRLALEHFSCKRK